MRELDDQVRETLKSRVEAVEQQLEGDCIFYYGPIFPTVEKRFREFIEKLRKNGTPRNRLIVFLNSPGGSAETVERLVEIIRYEQAKNLTITLLKKWLVEFKFKDWTTHQSNPAKLGQPVTHEDKEARAEEIATILSNNRLWHSHGRMIGVATLTTVLRLKIEDYSTDAILRDKILAYNGLLTDYIARNDFKFFLHSRCGF